MLLRVLTASLALAASSLVAAQYTGEVAYKTIDKNGAAPANVAELLKTPQDNQVVSLSGKLLKKVADEKYIFSDGSGEIRVEIDDELIMTVKVDNNTQITIVGEVEKDFMQDVEIDVKSIKLN